MVESMFHERYPTRAEVSDIATAIFDGADAIMTSEETSLGKYPVETIATMTDVAEHVEGVYKPRVAITYDERSPVPHAIARHAQQLADSLNTHCIVALTETGRTARDIAQFRGNKVIYALSPSIDTMQKLSVIRGVYPVHFTPTKPIEDIRSDIVSLVKTIEKQKKQAMVIVSGSIMRKRGSTNMVIVEH
jgi:pyruvate kinase